MSFIDLLPRLRNARRVDALQRWSDPTMAQARIMHTSYLGGKRAPSRISLIGTSVLIVEDEPLIALDLHSALGAAGAGLIAATETAEALRDPPQSHFRRRAGY